MLESSRAEAQVDALRKELAKAGEKPAAAMAAVKSPATRESLAAYRTLGDRVVDEVRRAGPAGQIDPSLENLSDGQLFSEMTALQSFNLRTFRRLAELREQDAQLRRRLEQLGRANVGATTRPAIATTDQLAREAVAALNHPQPSASWAAARQKMRNAIATARSHQFRDATIPPPAANSPFPPPANGVVIDDPRWQRYYYGPADPYSGGGAWTGSMYGDPFEFRGGGGVYERFDTRVNVDFDTRTRAQPDRRVNVQFDRRLNMHVDPRENF